MIAVHYQDQPSGIHIVRRVPMSWEEVLKNLNRNIEEAAGELGVDAAEGKPSRETVIGSDDILNLRIALNTAKSLREFLYLT
jgi:hypothetical protein